jgi:fumarylacetoacetate (FAA) hydrolase
VTKDDLERYKRNDRYDLTMTASVNGRQLSEGNFHQIHYTFAEMIERASADVTLYPGEVIGSGTVGTGCILELGTDVHRWLKAGDKVELTITGLGKLVNTIK